MAKVKPEPAPPPEANPQAGGSYTRNPDTGALTRVEGTEHPQDHAQADNAAPATQQE